MDWKQTEFADANVIVTNLKGADLVEQAWWWYNQDIVVAVAAQGAGLANVMFLRHPSAVIEDFPTGYTPALFQNLTRSVEAYPYRIDKATSRKSNSGGHPRNKGLEPDPDLVVQLVKDAIQRR
jgi:hypothetical protein